MKSIVTALVRDIYNVQTQSPLVLNLTNYVAMDFNANSLLAVGASPVMSVEKEELADLIQLSKCIVVNIGTLSQEFCKTVEYALDQASLYNKPVVFDPVGAGASQLRTLFAQKIFAHDAVKIIRGNASEIMNVCEFSTQTKGVDSTLHSEDVFLEIQKYLKNKSHSKIISISGAIDYIVSDCKISSVHHGDPLMASVTGIGCSASALIAAFLAINDDFAEAALHAAIVMGIAGEKAKKISKGPGSFRAEFLDALYNLNKDDFQNLKVNLL